MDIIYNNISHNKGSCKENFSLSIGLDFLDPTKALKDIMISFLFYLIKICIFGYVIYFLYKQSGLYYEKSVRYYLIFLIVGSIGLYAFTFLYFMYRCYNNGVNFSDMDYKAYALGSLLAPSFILSYAIFIFVANIIKVTPLVGFILYAFISFAFLIILSAGQAYHYAFEFAYYFIKCSKQ